MGLFQFSVENAYSVKYLIFCFKLSLINDLDLLVYKPALYDLAFLDFFFFKTPPTITIHNNGNMFYLVHIVIISFSFISQL